MGRRTTRTRETGVRHAQSRREQQNVAAGVWIEHVGGLILAVPLAVELEHRVDGPGRRGGDLLERMGVAVRHRPVRQRGLRERGVLKAGLGADQPVGHRTVVLEAAAELGVLRAATVMVPSRFASNDQAPKRCVNAAPSSRSVEPEPGWNSVSNSKPCASIRLVAPVGSLTPKRNAASVRVATLLMKRYCPSSVASPSPGASPR